MNDIDKFTTIADLFTSLKKDNRSLEEELKMIWQREFWVLTSTRKDRGGEMDKSEGDE